jgi:hypothetical protein
MGEAPVVLRRSRAIVSVAVPLTLLAACHAPDSAGRWTVQDSAGVEVVTNLTDPPAWHLGERPDVSLGTVNEEGPTQFYRVRDVTLLEDGGFVVANSGTDELRFFDARGRFRGRAGGHGSGPKEFNRLSMVEPFGDSLMTYDGGNDRVSVRTMDGTFVRSFRLDWSSGLVPSPQALLGAPGVLSIAVRPMTQLNHSGLNVDTVLVSHYDIEGHLVDSIQHLPFLARVVHMEGDLQTTLGSPFSAVGQVAPTPSGFCYAFGPSPTIDCFDLEGHLRRVVHAPIPTRPVTDADISRYWDDALAEARGRMVEILRRSRDWMMFPDAFPAFATLLADDRGRVWAQVYPMPHADERRWMVFDGGRAVGEIRVPAPFNILDVRGDRVAGVWIDDMGIEYVRVYRLRES